VIVGERTHPIAGLAAASPANLEEVVSTQVMAVNAFDAASILRAKPTTAEHVLPHRHGLEMLRVHAPRPAAEMIENQLARDRADHSDIGVPMSAAALGGDELTVTGADEPRAGPLPATVGPESHLR